MMTTIPTPTVSTPEHVAAKTVCLSLTLSRFGNKRKADMGDVQVEADKTLLRMSKTLLDSPELDAVKKHDAMTRAYIRSVSFRSLFRGGVVLVPVVMVPGIDATLADRAAERQGLVDAAVATYGQRLAETRDRLDIVYRTSDYPSVEAFRATFGIEWQYLTFDTPQRLSVISQAIFEQEREKAQKKLAAVADECRDAMRAGLAGLVDHMVERLTPDADGKAKTFKGSTVKNLNAFFATFEQMNVADDATLAALVSQARQLMDGVDPAALRGNEALRAAVSTGFAHLKAALDPLVVDRGTRAISFDDDEG